MSAVVSAVKAAYVASTKYRKESGEYVSLCSLNAYWRSCEEFVRTSLWLSEADLGESVCVCVCVCGGGGGGVCVCAPPPIPISKDKTFVMCVSFPE